jgi:hypothetical protein
MNAIHPTRGKELEIPQVITIAPEIFEPSALSL